MSRRELHKERLATTDESGRRLYLYPETVTGRFRNYRTLVYWILILIFLGLPWLNVGGEQSVLLDISKRKLIFFGITFLGHDTPLVFFVFAISVFAIAAVTAIFGRGWCGWACPQTVFIDIFFRKIEELTEGKARTRRERDNAPWTFEKVLRKSLKWFLFLVISVHLAHTFLGYFVGIRNLFDITTSPPSLHWGEFLTMLFVSGVLLFNFGWFREQFCIIACPYGRFQSVMMDKSALVVAYDHNRGEPRRGKVDKREDEGDCINCAKCVKVCPTGIDIRRGVQMECIACTACIDACDEIMDKISRPRGLIRYTTEDLLESGRWTFWRARPLLYISILLLLCAVFTGLVYSRSQLSVVYVRSKEAPFRLLDSGATVLNHFHARFSYRPSFDILVRLKIEGENLKQEELVLAKNPFSLKPGQSSVDFFVRTPRSQFKNGHKTLTILIQSEQNQEILDKQEIKLVGP